MELLGRPRRAWGLIFWTRAGSPAPVITRQLWAAEERTLAVTAGAAAATPRMRRRAVVAATSGRVEERCIGCPFSPGWRATVLAFRKRFRNCYQVDSVASRLH